MTPHVRVRHPVLDREMAVHPESVPIYARSGWEPVPVEPAPSERAPKGAGRANTSA